MSKTDISVEQWLKQMESHYLKIEDVKKMEYNQTTRYLCIDRNFYDLLPYNVEKANSMNALDFFKNNYKINYIHEKETKGKSQFIKNNELEELNNFEFHIEYTNDCWYPLKDGKLPDEDSQQVFTNISNHDIKRKWTEYDDNTKLGWRGPMINWEIVKSSKYKLYNVTKVN
jgi:hypothetical protein